MGEIDRCVHSQQSRLQRSIRGAPHTANSTCNSPNRELREEQPRVPSRQRLALATEYGRASNGNSGAVRAGAEDSRTEPHRRQTKLQERVPVARKDSLWLLPCRGQEPEVLWRTAEAWPGRLLVFGSLGKRHPFIPMPIEEPAMRCSGRRCETSHSCASGKPRHLRCGTGDSGQRGQRHSRATRE
jgi:hypothetical protein